jgi:hypothetical protein
MPDRPLCQHHTDVARAAARFEHLNRDTAHNLELIAAQCPTCRKTP